MKAALLCLAVALVGCAKSAEDGASPPAAPVVSHAPAGGGDNGFLWGLGGYLLGSHMAQSRSAPATAPASGPTYNIDRRTVINNPEPKPTVASVPPPAPAPTKVAAPAPAPAAKPTFAGPSGYSSIKQSAPAYSPSRSFSSGGRR